VPTATHEVALVHATPVSSLKDVWDPFGLGTIVQALPFQVSVSVLSREDPTAMQNVGLVHDTADRDCASVGDVFALGTIVHVETVAAEAVAESASTPTPAQAIPTPMRASCRSCERTLNTCRV